MAGSASNWFRPSSGALAGQAIYLAKAQRLNPNTGKPLPRSSVYKTLGQLKHSPEIHRPHGVARAGGAKPTTGGATSVLNDQTAKLVVDGRTRKVLASEGRLAVVRGTGLELLIVDVHTGRADKTGSTDKKAVIQDMRDRAPYRGESHVLKHLDSSGRAQSVVRAEGLPNPGTPNNSLDDIIGLARPNIVAASRRIYEDGPQAASSAGGARGDPLMAALQQAHGFDTLPAKVDATKLRQMHASGELTHIMSRGAGGMEHAIADEPFYGAGKGDRLFGAGMYTASRGTTDEEKMRADTYSRRYGGPNRQLAVMGLRKDARVIDVGTLANQRNEFVTREKARLSKTDPDWDTKIELIDAMSRDVGYFATAMGYDAATADYGTQGFDEGIIVYNRSAIVSQNSLE